MDMISCTHGAQVRLTSFKNAEGSSSESDSMSDPVSPSAACSGS